MQAKFIELHEISLCLKVCTPSRIPSGPFPAVWCLFPVGQLHHLLPLPHHRHAGVRVKSPQVMPLWSLKPSNGSSYKGRVLKESSPTGSDSSKSEKTAVWAEAPCRVLQAGSSASVLSVIFRGGVSPTGKLVVGGNFTLSAFPVVLTPQQGKKRRKNIS